MQRTLRLSAFLLLCLPLTACGIRGGLKTPPPLWGPGSVQDASDAEAVETEDDIVVAVDDNDGASETDEDFGYGVDVTRIP